MLVRRVTERGARKNVTMRIMTGTITTVTLLAGTVLGAYAQTGVGSATTATTGTASVSGQQRGASPNGHSGGTTSDAAKARVGAVQGVTGEAQKPAAGAAGQGRIGAVQGAGAIK